MATAHSVYLRNGEQLNINDHVYCSPQWSLRDGTPYSVARIMAFLPPEKAPPPEPGQPIFYTRVRLAWYYRPVDVSDRPLADSRLLLAAIYSEVTDINQIRGKCFVVHRDKINDLAGWKKKPDRFYFNKLFDPYIKKEFEIIQTADVRNLPDHIRNTLIDRYEYIVSEKEFLSDLTDPLRVCENCQEWCPGHNQDSIQCDRCKSYFHMECVQPPLAAKPARGYGWTCAPCSRRYEEAVDKQEGTNGNGNGSNKPRSSAQSTRGRGRPRKDRAQTDRDLIAPIKHFKMWPFRYFGQYNVAEDALHEEDLIWPKAPPRLGIKFQTNVPPTPELSMATRLPDEPLRGADDTIDVLSCVDILMESEMLKHLDAMAGGDKDLRHNVDWLTEAIRRFSDKVQLEKPLQQVRMDDLLRARGKFDTHDVPLMDREWTKTEAAAFEAAINDHGAELRAVRSAVRSGRTMPEVVRYYGHWKCGKLGEENVRIRDLRRMGDPSGSSSQLFSPPAGAFDGPGGSQKVGFENADSVITNPAKSATCGACRTKDTPVWWRAPRGIGSTVLCDTCGTNWRKYADLNVRSIREERSVDGQKEKDAAGRLGSGKGEKREGTPMDGPKVKRIKTTVGSGSSTPPPPASNLPQIKCLACNKNGPVGKVVKCKKCGFKAHASSCGAVVDANNVDAWECDICRNDESLEASVYPRCLLCPRQSLLPVGQKGKQPQNISVAARYANINPDSFLRACKPTEGSGWAHVLCSVFIPEPIFTDPLQLHAVENLNVINHQRWIGMCTLCNEDDGAVVKCNDCSKEYHISCAWKAGFKFGFEIQPIKSSRRDTTKIVTFRGETGLMNAITICKDHETSGRHVHSMCATDSASGESALQVYCQTYKQAPVSSAHGLLRKAQRLDQLITIKPVVRAYKEPSPGVDPQVAFTMSCHQCKTEFSPMFYPVGAGQ
ncbi:hypothetical protein DL96DRAFT_1585044 [Flagelloscypha sp. PMI_526]|nr:hypothetical protein DL96DRAFT_1585044 [Flagelloscypha sp. PMI_526]